MSYKRVDILNSVLPLVGKFECEGVLKLSAQFRKEVLGFMLE
jgi:hypothetical protein